MGGAGALPASLRLSCRINRFRRRLKTKFSASHFWNNVGSFGWQAKRFFLHHRVNGPQNLPNAANNKHRESEQRGVADDAMLKRATSFEPNVVGADL